MLGGLGVFAVRAASQIDDNLSLRILEGVVGVLDGSEREATLVKQWNELAGFDELSRLCEDVAMVSAGVTGKKRQQRENARVCGALAG